MPDITANRHQGNPSSHAAYERGKDRHGAARDRIYELLAQSDGMTSKEIAVRLNWALNTFSGRLTELKAAGLIRGTGERRLGAEVHVVVRRAEQQRCLGKSLK